MVVDKEEEGREISTGKSVIYREIFTAKQAEKPLENIVCFRGNLFGHVLGKKHKERLPYFLDMRPDPDHFWKLTRIVVKTPTNEFQGRSWSCFRVLPPSYAPTPDWLALDLSINTSDPLFILPVTPMYPNYLH